MRLDDLACDVADVLEADARVVLALRRGEAVAPGSRAARRRGRGSTPARSRTTCRGRPGSSRGCSTDAASRPGGAPRTSRASRSRGPGRGRARPAAAGSPSCEPSACRVELPSKFQTGRSSSVGATVNATIFVLLRRFGTGLVAVEPDVFELVLGHAVPPCRTFRQPKKGPRRSERSARPHCLQRNCLARAVVGAARGPELSGPGG